MRKSILLIALLFIICIITAQEADATIWCLKRISGHTSLPGSPINVPFFGTTTTTNSGIATQFQPDTSVWSNTPGPHYSDPGPNPDYSSACPGNVWLELWSDNGSNRPLNLLATSDTRPCTGMQVGTTTQGWMTGKGFTFSGANIVTISSASLYWLILRANGSGGILPANSLYMTESTTDGITLTEVNGVFTPYDTKQWAMKVYTNNAAGVIFESSYENCAGDWTVGSQNIDCYDDHTKTYTGLNAPCYTTDNAPLTTPGPYEEVYAAANYPGGIGGRGQRHYLGIIKCCDAVHTQGGPANASGGLLIDFDYPGPSELWARMYIRYENGFRFGGLGYEKAYYPSFWYENRVDSKAIYSSSGYHSVLGNYVSIPDDYCDQADGGTHCVSPLGDNTNIGAGFFSQEGDQRHHSCTSCGFADYYPLGMSDGTWHEVEMHMKFNLTPNTPNGTLEIWYDGVRKVADIGTVEYGNPPNAVFAGNFGLLKGFWNFKTGDNGITWWDFNIPGCHYTDFDDIVMNTDGPVGPISPTLPPLAAGRPVNVHVE